MPRQRRRAPPRKQAPLGFYDLSTRLLPGGTELQALGTGFSLDRERGLGYVAGYSYATSISNANTLLDASSQQPWIIADSTTGHLRSLNAPQLFREFQTEMEEVFTADKTQGNISLPEFQKGDAWKRVTGLTKNTPLTGPFEPLSNRYVKLKDGVFLHHRMTHYPLSPPVSKYPQYRIT